jgi:hypothetical protein
MNMQQRHENQPAATDPLQPAVADLQHSITAGQAQATGTVIAILQGRQLAEHRNTYQTCYKMKAHLHREALKTCRTQLNELCRLCPSSRAAD